MKYLKPFLLSLIPAFIVTFAMVILERGWDIFDVGTLNVFWMTFLSYFILLEDNEAMIRRFWSYQWPDWCTTADIWICNLGMFIIIFSIVGWWRMYSNGQILSQWYTLIPMVGAAIYRRTYLRHAPENIEEFERQRKYEEDVNSYVTVAECKDVQSAHIIKNRLEANGIEAITFGESAPKYIGTVPVRVLVRKKDKEAAEKLINE